MLNLIRRDAVMQKGHLYLFLPFIAFFIIMDSHPVLTLLVASLYIPFNALACDEKAHTHLLLNSLPYTRKEIVASRYLGAVVYMGMTMIVTVLALFVANVSFSMRDIALASGFFLVFISLTFPLFYIFKPGYIVYAVIISFLLLTGIGPPIVLFVMENITALTAFLSGFSTLVLYMGSAGIVLGLYAVSWAFTTLVYQRKAI